MPCNKAITNRVVGFLQIKAYGRLFYCCNLVCKSWITATSYRLIWMLSCEIHSGEKLLHLQIFEQFGKLMEELVGGEQDIRAAFTSAVNYLHISVSIRLILAESCGARGSVLEGCLVMSAWQLLSAHLLR